MIQWMLSSMLWRVCLIDEIDLNMTSLCGAAVIIFCQVAISLAWAEKERVGVDEDEDVGVLRLRTLTQGLEYYFIFHHIS